MPASAQVHTENAPSPGSTNRQTHRHRTSAARSEPTRVPGGPSSAVLQSEPTFHPQIGQKRPNLAKNPKKTRFLSRSTRAFWRPVGLQNVCQARAKNARSRSVTKKTQSPTEKRTVTGTRKRTVTGTRKIEPNTTGRDGLASLSLSRTRRERETETRPSRTRVRVRFDTIIHSSEDVFVSSEQIFESKG